MAARRQCFRFRFSTHVGEYVSSLLRTEERFGGFYSEGLWVKT